MSNEQHSIAVESGAAFADLTDAEVFVEATFIEAGNQLQQVFIGLEPVLLIQPEYDADVNEVKFIVTGVDLDPSGLVDVLEVILDAARLMLAQQEEAYVEHELAVIRRKNELQASGPDEYPTGFYESMAREQLAAEAVGAPE